MLRILIREASLRPVLTRPVIIKLLFVDRYRYERRLVCVPLLFVTCDVREKVPVSVPLFGIYSRSQTYIVRISEVRIFTVKI
jgi:hypothetical protein